MLSGTKVFIVLAIVALLVVLAVATHSERDGVLRRVLPALHGRGGGHR